LFREGRRSICVARFGGDAADGEQGTAQELAFAIEHSPWTVPEAFLK